MRLIIFVLIFFVAEVKAQSLVPDFIVSADGSGNFKTVQEAINAVPDFRKKETIIFVKAGTYKEKLQLHPTKQKVKLIGEDVQKVKITYDDFASRKNSFGEEIGTGATASVLIFGDDFFAENITFENAAGPVGQAVAVRVNGDRVQFVNCRFLGFQDTLYAHGDRSRQYYKNCYIEGTVDFIFGWSTAFFDNCTIFCKKSGYVTAASTLEGQPFGLVFLNCKITGDAPESTFYLGRPWRPFAKTVFINCFLDKQIKPEGWHNWNKPDAEKTSFYAEYKSHGPGAKGDRVLWAKQLSDDEAAKYTVENVLGGSDGWLKQK
ncbi:pectinesterase family protein [Pseudochryseolinea flava]|uniref:Pectinesterase n=1 Tax=Pseudochryseolinea flava TaxID=2059302 RepID=A0A364XZU5_9BACT|nr:pectinesterase family protein [Pseudochryseolinea flava]RAW00044.1 pectin esterase [Pseudochryseolinea flava]